MKPERCFVSDVLIALVDGKVWDAAVHDAGPVESPVDVDGGDAELIVDEEV